MPSAATMLIPTPPLRSGNFEAAMLAADVLPAASLESTIWTIAV